VLSKQECELFGISYVKSGFDEVDKKVEEAITNFHNSLVPTGPELWKGKVEVCFFERRKKQNTLGTFFGFKNNDDKCSFEHWVIPVLMNATPRAVGNDSASAIERDRRQQIAEQTLFRCMTKILSTMHDIDHMPLGGAKDGIKAYEFEIRVGGSKEKDKADGPMIQKVLTNPPGFTSNGS
jgi:hypothetical protein